jgi:hypothetical protein
MCYLIPIFCSIPFGQKMSSLSPQHVIVQYASSIPLAATHVVFQNLYDQPVSLITFHPHLLTSQLDIFSTNLLINSYQHSLTSQLAIGSTNLLINSHQHSLTSQLDILSTNQLINSHPHSLWLLVQPTC